VLDFLSRHYRLQYILATTLPDNTRSIRLLEKLGLRFDKAIETNGELLWVYHKPLDVNGIT
jgi:RimJ/RimL family protein N-acetyltransferase